MLDTKTILHYDDASDVLTVQRTQDVEPILNNVVGYVNSCDGYSPSREMRFLAEIPNTIIEQWLNEGINIFDPDHKQAVKRKLAEYTKLTNTNKTANAGIIVKGAR